MRLPVCRRAGAAGNFSLRPIADVRGRGIRPGGGHNRDYPADAGGGGHNAGGHGGGDSGCNCRDAGGYGGADCGCNYRGAGGDCRDAGAIAEGWCAKR